MIFYLLRHRLLYKYGKLALKCCLLLFFSQASSSCGRLLSDKLAMIRYEFTQHQRNWFLCWWRHGVQFSSLLVMTSALAGLRVHAYHVTEFTVVHISPSRTIRSVFRAHQQWETDLHQHTRALHSVPG